jgi:hypothetical protein
VEDIDTRWFTRPLFRPGDIGSDAERKGFNVSSDHRPALVVGASGPADVVAAVECAATAGRAVGVMATGHGPAVGADGQVLVNTRRMNRVEVDPTARTARVAAGVRWGQAQSKITGHGLAALNGASSDVGVVGYTLGGGVGPLGRQYGSAADHVRTLDVVTADGRLRRVSATSDPDLFWALRGGKGNFGIVVSMEFDLVPVTQLYGGGIYFTADHAPDAAADALHAYSDWVAGVPEEMASSVRMIRFPDLPAVPTPFRGRFVTRILMAFCSSAVEGERLVEPLRKIGNRSWTRSRPSRTPRSRPSTTTRRSRHPPTTRTRCSALSRRPPPTHSCRWRGPMLTLRCSLSCVTSAGPTADRWHRRTASAIEPQRSTCSPRRSWAAAVSSHVSDAPTSCGTRRYDRGGPADGP